MARKTTEDRDADRYERYALSFQQACMSNAKWRKALLAIAESGVELVQCEYKCIDSEHVTEIRRGPRVIDINSNRFNDGAFQPIEYKWLEWIRFPRRIQTNPGVGHYVIQDIGLLQEIILDRVAATTELSEDYLCIYGYKG